MVDSHVEADTLVGLQVPLAVISRSMQFIIAWRCAFDHISTACSLSAI